jgi:vesicle transport through interaction with t-SNAREs protein 1
VIDSVIQEYKACLSRIRSFLAGTRSRATLTEADRLLQEAKKCAMAMQGLAETEGNALRVSEARNLLQRDVAPLAKEVHRAINEMGREELFPGSVAGGAGSSSYQPPSADGSSDLEALIQSSDSLLRESQSILAETEQIGTSTLHQMGRQREQIENANRSLEVVTRVALEARNILTRMSRRALKNKLVLYFLITLLGSANMYVLYLIYKKHHHS